MGVPPRNHLTRILLFCRLDRQRDPPFLQPSALSPFSLAHSLALSITNHLLPFLCPPRSCCLLAWLLSPSISLPLSLSVCFHALDAAVRSLLLDRDLHASNAAAKRLPTIASVALFLPLHPALVSCARDSSPSLRRLFPSSHVAHRRTRPHATPLPFFALRTELRENALSDRHGRNVPIPPHQHAPNPQRLQREALVSVSPEPTCDDRQQKREQSR